MIGGRLRASRAGGLPAERVADVGEASDEALAARGDAESFMVLYRRHLPAVYRYAYARTGNRQDAENVTAVAFEQAWASLGRYRPVGSFRGWLFTVARRALADHRRRGGPARDIGEALPDELFDASAGPEEATLLAEDLRRLLRIMAELSKEQQELIALRVLGGLRFDEIARIVGKREPAVKMSIYRALDAIRRRYHDERE